MNGIKWFTAGLLGMTFLLTGGETVISRDRDSADRAHITRWYKWGSQDDQKSKKYVQCEGWLEYDFELKEPGWYEFWQKGCSPEWGRIISFDGVPVLNGLRIAYRLPKEEQRELQRKNKGYNKDFSIYLESGKHTLEFRREMFPGAFASWKLVKADAVPEKRIRTVWKEQIIRAEDHPVLHVNAGSEFAAEYSFVLRQKGTGKVFKGADFSVAAMKKPKTVDIKFPRLPEGVYTLEFASKDGKKFMPGDSAAQELIVIDSTPTPVSSELKKTLVADIDCAKTEPYREKDGKTTVVNASFGSYRESSGNASHPHWALDGFSYQVQLPDITHTYQLVVDYPDDDFRSSGFWVNDGSDIRSGGVCLTGGVETGGSYRLTRSMKTHEAFFYPRGKDLVIAVLNLNQGSKAAASRIRIYRIDDCLPAMEKGIQRGRLAGFFFEENGRWDRFFGAGHGEPNEITEPILNTMTAMKRWAEWNRFCGQNLMSPSVLGYGSVEYPSKAMTCSRQRAYHAPRMLALIAEKYGQKFLPHMCFHGDVSFDKEMGVEYINVPDPKHPGKQKTVFQIKDPDVIEWNKDGSSVIRWRQFSYNPLHPTVQKYVIDAVGELADTLADSPAFFGISIRIPLSWQFSGVTGLNSADYGYGDWNMAQFEKDTGIKVPGKAGDPKRFSQRYKFLMGKHEQLWLKWKHDRILAYYKAIRDRVRKANPKAEIFFMWWPNSNGRTIARQMKESGIAPEDMKTEPDFSFYGMQIRYGRRYFCPPGAMKRESALYDPETYEMSLTGRRPVCLYSEYYEVNQRLNWEELGGKKYCAFDALTPGGINELRSYAVPLAMADIATFINGGNGWIFGTPSLTAPFMREFLALPTDKFEAQEGINGDPAAIRVARTKEGLFFYAVNQSDLPVKVKVKVKGELFSASTGEKASSEFELGGYGLKSFLVKGAKARLLSVQTSYPETERQRIGKMMEYAKELKVKLETDRAGMEQPLDRHNVALRRLDHALKSFAAGRTMEAFQDMSSPEVVELYDHTGDYPEGFFESKKRIGGFEKNTVRMPALKFKNVIGGKPLELPGPVLECKAPDGRRFVAIKLDGSSRLMAFDPAGKLTAVCMPAKACGPQPGDIRRPGQSVRLVRSVSALVMKDNDLLLNMDGETYYFDPVTLRQKTLNPAVVALPKQGMVKSADFPDKKDPCNLLTASQLKVYNGKIWFISGEYLKNIDPKTGTVSKVLKLIPGQKSFTFDKDGSLYTAAHQCSNGRGTGFSRYEWQNGSFAAKPELLNDGKTVFQNAYTVPTDLDVSDKGILVRVPAKNNDIEFKYWKDGKFSKAFTMGAASSYSQDFRFGFLREPDGTLYVAGGSARILRCYAPDGKLRWERKFNQVQNNGSIPFRSLSAVAKDRAGRLWVADQFGDRILCFNSINGTYLGKFGGSGSMLDSPDGRFHSISGLAVVGNVLYVADYGNNRIVSYEIAE